MRSLSRSHDATLAATVRALSPLGRPKTPAASFFVTARLQPPARSDVVGLVYVVTDVVTDVPNFDTSELDLSGFCWPMFDISMGYLGVMGRFSEIV